MKSIRLLLALLALAAPAVAQTSIQKVNGTNVLTTLSNPLAIGSGQTLTIASGGSLEFANPSNTFVPGSSGGWTSTSVGTNAITGAMTASVNDNFYYLTLTPTIASAGSNTDIRTLNVEPTLTGSVATAALRAGRFRVVNSSSAALGTVEGFNGNIVHNGSALATSGSGMAISASLGSSGNMTGLVFFSAGGTTLSSTGVITGTITGFSVGASVSKSSAAVFAGYNVTDQNSNATLTTAFRGQNASASGKWNAYMDGTANNYFRGEIQTGATAAGAARVGYNLSTYGAGTAYALTNTAAAIDFGTTDPALVLDKAGTYLIIGQVNLAYNAATVAAETAAFKVRRTNNTAADLSVVVPIDLPVSTALTYTYGVVQIPPFVYTTTATDDAVTLFANVSAGLGAGTIDATAVGTSLVAIRLY
jgi:hypothetical protein